MINTASYTLHIAQVEKFIPKFIKLVRGELKGKRSKFYTYGVLERYPYEIGGDSRHIEDSKSKIVTWFRRYPSLLKEMYCADKIVLHGLFDIRLVVLLAFNPILLNKCYWVIWGGDLYQFDDKFYPRRKFKWIKEVFRKLVIKNIGNLVTYIDGDIKVARDVYGAKGRYVECLMYLSNTFEESYKLNSNHTRINILVGNSADPSNNHIQVLRELSSFKNSDFEIIIPLSYGDVLYADSVREYSTFEFGSKVRFINEIMPYEEYIDMLNRVDIAIFNHERQQAMGNTINLLGLGKTVYCRRGTPQWDLFESLGIKIKDSDDINMELISPEEKKRNIKIVSHYFSKENLLRQYGDFL